MKIISVIQEQEQEQADHSVSTMPHDHIIMLDEESGVPTASDIPTAVAEKDPKEEIASRLITEKLGVKCMVYAFAGCLTMFRVEFPSTTSEATLKDYVNQLEQLLSVKHVEPYTSYKLNVFPMDLSAVVEKLQAASHTQAAIPPDSAVASSSSMGFFPKPTPALINGLSGEQALRAAHIEEAHLAHVLIKIT